MIELGYSAFKAAIFPNTHFNASAPKVDKVARMMADLRAVVGHRGEIMIDFHGRPPNSVVALRVIQASEPTRPM